jgi:MFS family permease
LAGEEIPLGARIIAVADSYDTITGARLYRRSYMTPEEAVADISARSGDWYDPDVVDALRTLHGLPVLEREPATEQVDEVPADDEILVGLRSLRQRGRLLGLLTAIGISSLGDPLTTVGTLVVVYATTRQPLLVAATYVVKAVATILVGMALGQYSDRIDRRTLIVGLELLRGSLMVATPLLLTYGLWTIFVVMFAHATIEAIVQPARQAAIPELVLPREVRAATAAMAAVNTAGSMAGVLLAGLILLVWNRTSLLFVIDGVTFWVAAAAVVWLGNLGGGVPARVGNGIRFAFGIARARAHLVIAGIGAFFIAMSLPTLVVLAYQQSHQGAVAFVILEAVLTVGMVLGNMLTPRLRDVSGARSLRLGLLTMGSFSVLIGLSPLLPATATLLFIASIGNAVYTTANIVSLLQIGTARERGRIMGARFTIGNMAAILGSATGGWLTAVLGPRLAYAALGIGLIGLFGLTIVLLSRPGRPTVVRSIAADESQEAMAG